MSDLYTLPDLPYDPGALEPHVSGRIMELHHDKHHAGYVKGANETLERLHEMRGKGDFRIVSMLEKNLAFHVSGHMLHSLFWSNLGPDGGGDPTGELAELLDDTFGSVGVFRQHMREAAATIQGSGWRSPRGSPSPVGSSSSRSTTTRATTGREPCRFSRSTAGSTPGTCNTRIARPTSSTPSGTSWIGATWPAASRRPRHDDTQLTDSDRLPRPGYPLLALRISSTAGQTRPKFRTRCSTLRLPWLSDSALAIRRTRKARP